VLRTALNWRKTNGHGRRQKSSPLIEKVLRKRKKEKLKERGVFFSSCQKVGVKKLGAKKAKKSQSYRDDQPAAQKKAYKARRTKKHASKIRA